MNLSASPNSITRELALRSHLLKESFRQYPDFRRGRCLNTKRLFKSPWLALALKKSTQLWEPYRSNRLSLFCFSSSRTASSCCLALSLTTALATFRLSRSFIKTRLKALAARALFLISLYFCSCKSFNCLNCSLNTDLRLIFSCR